MTQVATSWLVYRLTRSEFLLGFIGFAAQLPTFLLAPLGGVWADRLDRRSVLTLTQILLASQTLTMAVLTLSGRITLLEIVCLSLLQGIINAFEIPCRNAFLVDLVNGREDWGNAIALTYSMDNLARLVGAALAGFTIAAVGEGLCFTIDGMSYVAVKRGRVMSYWTVAYMGGVPSGSLLVGGLAHVLGAPGTLVLCGVGCVFGAAWFWGKRDEIRGLVNPIYKELGFASSDVASKGRIFLHRAAGELKIGLRSSLTSPSLAWGLSLIHSELRT